MAGNASFPPTFFTAAFVFNTWLIKQLKRARLAQGQRRKHSFAHSVLEKESHSRVVRDETAP
jgi:hypothetical protein